MKKKAFKYKHKNNSCHKKQTKTLNKNELRKINQFQTCRKCPYFPSSIITNSPYEVDNNGVKHRDIQYLCLYDLHEIFSNKNTCPKGCY